MRSFLMAICFCFFCAEKSDAQIYLDDWGVGGSGIYNFQTESWGADLRAHLIFNERWVLAPEVSYFFPFNPIHELYAGMSLHYEFMWFNYVNPYLSAGAYYNNWMNSEAYTGGLKKKHNFAPEVGIGIVRNEGCIRPFIENRYDIKWQEGNLRLGVLIFFNSCGKRKEDCPGAEL